MVSSQRIAVITGSHKGLGRAIARKLAMNTKLRVIITSRKAQDGLLARQQLAEEGIDVDYFSLDVGSDSSVAQFTKWLTDTYGRVDVLINNAGINPSAQADEASMLAARAETMMETFSTNVLAVQCITQALVPLMQKNNYGRIVNVSSEMASLGLMEQDPYPQAPSYRLSKVGLNALTVMWARALCGSNVLINAYSPGWMQTDMGGANAPLTADEGAETAVYLATLPDGGHQGKFFAEMRKAGGAVALPW
ncbi:MAG TPA: SDR family oxidoreductase [Limnobacter sp.]|nr:SDR family oxidoreductase [Limnobacter sp.]